MKNLRLDWIVKNERESNILIEIGLLRIVVVDSLKATLLVISLPPTLKSKLEIQTIECFTNTSFK